MTRVLVPLALALAASACGSNAPNEPGCPATAEVLAQCVAPPGDKVRLSITVYGTDRAIDLLATGVEFYDNLGVRHFCYSTSLANNPGTCTAEFARTSQARIQRILGLIPEDEGGWRLSGWGGACSLNADTEPRGGQCTLTMDSDKTVTVTFEKRIKVNIQNVLQNSPMSVRWQMSHTSQKNGGNPTIRSGTFDCNSPSGLPYCNFTNMFFDAGTVLTFTAGNGGQGPPAFWKSWGGCAPIGVTPWICALTLTNDATVTGTWGFN